MPSPVGHLLGGAAVYLAASRKEDRSRFTLGAVLFGSILPDFDFVPGLFVGKLSDYHHGISHSLTFAVLFGAWFFVVAKCVHKDIAGKAAVLAGLGYVSHVILDFVGVHEGTRGVPIFWPLSDHKFGLNLRVLGYFYYSDHGLWSVIRWNNVTVLLRELFVIGTPVLLLFRRERRAAQQSKHTSEAKRQTATKIMGACNE